MEHPMWFLEYRLSRNVKLYVAEEYHWKDGKQDGICRWSENGKIVFESRMED